MSEDITPTMPPKDTSETVSRSSNVDSSFFGVSVRAWIAYTLVVTVCCMSLLDKTVTEPLYGAAMIALGFYFGQAKK